MLLKDGYSSTISFALLPTFKIEEVEVTPIGLDGGEAIDQTTMRNAAFKTKAPQSLVELTPLVINGAYDAQCYEQAMSDLINTNGEVTQSWSDGADYTFFGYLQKIDPQPLTIGGRPIAAFTIIPTCVDPADNSESGPVYTGP